MGLVPEEPGPPGEIAGQRELLSRLQAVVQAKDAENAVLRRELDAERELRRRLEPMLSLAQQPTQLEISLEYAFVWPRLQFHHCCCSMMRDQQLDLLSVLAALTCSAESYTRGSCWLQQWIVPRP